MKKNIALIILFILSVATYAQDQTVNGNLLQQLNNQWLSPANLQLGRSNTNIIEGKAIIGVTNGNLHLDSYPGHALYLNFYQRDSSGGNKGVVVRTNGDVGIGVQYPTSKLDVRGKIIANEVEIKIIQGADHVFYPNYPLMPLKEVETFVKENNHLPDIPSEKQMQENGLNLNDMQIKLLQKIEELTLYIIEQDKQNKDQQKQIEELKMQLKNNQP